MEQIKNQDSNHVVVLITGGFGFLGQALVAELLDRRQMLRVGEIRIVDSKEGEVPKGNIPIVSYRADITDPSTFGDAFVGVDVVFHMAGMVDWGFGDPKKVWDVNVNGTRNVLHVAKEEGVKIFLLTSSIDVHFTGDPLVGITEDHPLPTKFSGQYAKSKAAAEQLVLKENHKTFQTVVIRPGPIYGERDPYQIPGLIKMSQAGIFARIGNKKKRLPMVYVGNAAYQHVCTAVSMQAGNLAPAGQVYFSVDTPSQNFFTTFEPILDEMGVSTRPKKLWLPYWLLLPFACLVEFTTWLVSPIKKLNPKFNRFSLKYLCTDFTASNQKAYVDIAYEPIYDKKMAQKRTAYWFNKSH